MVNFDSLLPERRFCLLNPMSLLLEEGRVFLLSFKVFALPHLHEVGDVSIDGDEVLVLLLGFKVVFE